LASTFITGATSESTVAGGDQILIHDDSAGALRKMTRTNFVSGLNPAFSAYLSGSLQNINSGSFTKVNFDAELFDTNNNFASGKFTPTVAGYYQLNTNILFNGIGSGVIAVVEIYKNGSNYARGNGGYLNNTNGDLELIATTIAFANGTTDYFEVYVYQNSGSAKTVYNFEVLTSFNGCLIRGNA
jgi:hypothetical protein